MAFRRVAVTVVVVVAAVVIAAVGVAMAMDEAEAKAEDDVMVEDIADLVDEIVNEINEELGMGQGNVIDSPSSTNIGNIVYSTTGFLLGGLLLFVSLFDSTRKPVITFFDGVFGRQQTRRRRDINMGLESRVAAAFHAFTNAVDKMDAVLRIAGGKK